jgi:hypothetical protein
MRVSDTRHTRLLVWHPTTSVIWDQITSGASSLRDFSETSDLPVEFGWVDGFGLPRQWSSRGWIVHVPRHEVDVQVRHGIPEQLVVHVAGCEHLLDHPRHGLNVAPVRGRFRGRQARKVRHVPFTKDDDRVARSDAMALKVSVA